jgi:CRISPR system Cascade subunit CasA
MATYNLIDEPWIPFLNHDGTVGHAGLKEVLCQAHKIGRIFHASPLINVTVHRLLLSLLHRNFGPKSLREWKGLWREHCWDEATLLQYFDKWRTRFDLFHQGRPFYQVEKMPDAQSHPVARLILEAAAGNNATLFDHRFDDRPEALDPASAARYLLACQSFSIGFGKSNPFYFSDSTLIRGFTVLALGANLFETLALNLIPYNKEFPLPQVGTDLPAWEYENPRKPDKGGSPIAGYLDYLTWQSRRIHLFPEPDGTVRYVQVQQGLKLPEPEPLDPFKCYQKKPSQGISPLAINPEKALWRNSHVLFQTQDASYKRPEVFNWLARVERLRRSDEIEASKAYQFAATGLATEIGKSASVILWREEHLPLPLAYLEEPELVAKLKECLSLADNVGEVLRQAVRFLCHQYLLPLAGNKALGRGQKSDVNALTERLAPARAFWPRLEVPFKRFLEDLAEDIEHNEQGVSVYGNRVIPEWAEILNHTARDAFRETVAQLGQDARALKAVAVVQPIFRGKLSTELKPYSQEVAHA